MFAAIVLFIVLGEIAAFGYILNRKTPVPPGCENMKENCEGCRIISCVNHPSKGELK